MTVTKAGKGIIYVLENDAMPGLVKIGTTSRKKIQERMKELFTTGVPAPFRCVFAIEIHSATNVERALHTAFGPNRFSPNREFFKLDSEQAIVILNLLSGTDVTPEIEKELNHTLTPEEKEWKKINKKRPNMNYEKMGIIGKTLVYKNNTEIKVVVANEREVKFNAQLMSLTAVTRQLLGLNEYSVQPAPYWICEGKSLTMIYDETYPKEETQGLLP